MDDEIKKEFFQAAAMSELLYGCTTWTQMKHLEKKLNENMDDTYSFEQILEETPKKIATVEPLTSHLTNCPSKMGKTY